MQSTYSGASKKRTYLAPAQNGETMLHFTVQDGFPFPYTLTLNLSSGVLSSLACVDGRPLMVAQEQFTRGETSVLRPLLESFPHYCPYETIFAHFYNGTVTEKIIARCRQHLQEAATEKLWDQEMRAVRSALSRTRLKLRSFGLDVSTILAVGYMLMVTVTPAQSA